MSDDNESPFVSRQELEGCDTLERDDLSSIGTAELKQLVNPDYVDLPDHAVGSTSVPASLSPSVLCRLYGEALRLNPEKAVLVWRAWQDREMSDSEADRAWSEIIETAAQ